jgi:predicted  nucleic acid-binding Zn-ribbon protein
MAHLIIPGYPKTFSHEELRANADRLAMSGHSDEAALLHALLDAYEDGARDARTVAEADKDRRAAEKDADRLQDEVGDLEAKLEALQEAVSVARKTLELSLGAVERGDLNAVRILNARTLGALVSATEKEDPA